MSVVPLAEVKTYLDLNSDEKDLVLKGFIEAAEEAIAARIGPLAATELTRQVRGRSTALVLPVLPAISLTSVTPIGSPALLLSDLSLDDNTGMVTYAATHQTFWAPRYTVIYTAGWYQDDGGSPVTVLRPLPATLSLAVKRLTKHFFESQRGSATRKPTMGSSTEVNNRVPGAADLFPIQVEQLLALHTSINAF